MKLQLISFLILFGIFTQGSAYAKTSLTDSARALAAETTESQVVTGIDGWLFLKEELAHIGAGEFWGDAASRATRSAKKEYGDPLPAIVDFNHALAEKGITLYLLVVPPKALVYADKLDPSITEVKEESRIYERFYSQLEEAGVKALNLLPELQERAKEKPNLYCKTDTHFSGDGLLLFARSAAQVIKREGWYDESARIELSRSQQQVSIKGDLAQMKGDNNLREEIEISVVVDKATGNPVESDPGSPVILLGDSHTLVFSAGGDLHAKGAGLFDNLSEELGFAIDLLGVRGSASTPARIKFYQRSKKDGDYLKGKKVLIYCFAARELTGAGGWRTIPVSP
jgi:hypothetical protein